MKFITKLRKSILRRVVPKNKMGDAFYSWCSFVTIHRRLPRKRSGHFNDQLYCMKVDGTLLDPLRQFNSDKEYVKIYIAGTIGDKFNIETYDILRSPSEIDDYTPARFPCVVKPTHLSGSVRICSSSDSFPQPELLKKWLARSLYKKTREQNYKFLKPKIIIEEFISHDSMTIPEDYKIFCFHGVPKFVQVDSDRFTGHTRNFYDTEWCRLDVEWNYPNRPLDHPKPEALTEILRIATKLSAPFDFIRVDLYAIGKELWVGEITNCPENASGVFKTREMEHQLYHWEAGP